MCDCDVRRALEALVRKPAPEQARLLRKLLGGPETSREALEVLHAAVTDAAAAHDATSLLLHVYQLSLALPESPTAAAATPGVIEALALVSESTLYSDAFSAIVGAVPADVLTEALQRARVAERAIANCSIMGQVLVRATPTDIHRCLSAVAATGVQLEVHVSEPDDAARLCKLLRQANVTVPVELVVHAPPDSSLADWITISQRLRGMLASHHTVTVELPQRTAEDDTVVSEVLDLLEELGNDALRIRGSYGNSDISLCMISREQHWAHARSVNVSAVAALVECIAIRARNGARCLHDGDLAKLANGAMHAARARGALAVELCVQLTDARSIARNFDDSILSRAHMILCPTEEYGWHTDVVCNALCSSARPYLAVVVIGATAETARELIGRHEPATPAALEAVIAPTSSIPALVRALGKLQAPIRSLRLEHMPVAHSRSFNYSYSSGRSSGAEDDYIAWAAAWESLRCLKIIGIGADELAAATTAAVRHNKTLVALSVAAGIGGGAWKVTPEVIAALADAIRANTTLVELDIQLGRINLNKNEDLFEAIVSNTSLHSVTVAPDRWTFNDDAAESVLQTRGGGARQCSTLIASLSTGPGAVALADGLVALSAWICHAVPVSPARITAVERLLLTFTNKTPLWHVVEVVDSLAAAAPSASPTLHDAFCAHVLPRVLDNNVEQASRAVGTQLARLTATRITAEAALAEETTAACSCFLRSLANAMTQVAADGSAAPEMPHAGSTASGIRLRALDGAQAPLSAAAVARSRVLTSCLTVERTAAGDGTLDVHGITDGATLTWLAALLEQDAGAQELRHFTDTAAAGGSSDARALARLAIGAAYLDAPRVCQWATREFAIALSAQLRGRSVGTGSALVRSLAD